MGEPEGTRYNSAVYRNTREKVVLHTSGIPNHTGDDCVNPPPRLLSYWSFWLAVYTFFSDLPGVGQGLHDRHQVLDDNARDLIEYASPDPDHDEWGEKKRPVNIKPSSSRRALLRRALTRRALLRRALTRRALLRRALSTFSVCYSSTASWRTTPPQRRLRACAPSSSTSSAPTTPSSRPTMTLAD
jgi:hypothetical protein